MRSVLVLVLTVGAPTAVAAPTVKAKPVQPDILVGTWQAEQVFDGGADMTRINKDLTYTFTKDGRWIVRGRHEDPKSYLVDLTADPPTIELRSDGVLKGIFQRDGDRLILCFGNTRPTVFPAGPLPQSVPKGVNYFVMVKVKD
jgi:uncharacterized protein (TIGR03067 family)